MPSGQGAAEVDHRIGAARSTFVRHKRSLWGRRELSTATKGRIYQAIVRTILLYSCETCPLRAVDLRKLEVFDNDCLRYILRCCRIDREPTTTLRRRLNLHPLPHVLLHCHLRWFGHAAQRPEGELIRDVFLPISLPNWRKCDGGQLKTWTSTIKDDLAALSDLRVVVFGDGIAINLPFRVTWLRMSEPGLRWFEMLYLLGRKPVPPDQGESRYKSSQVWDHLQTVNRRNSRCRERGCQTPY